MANAFKKCWCVFSLSLLLSHAFLILFNERARKDCYDSENLNIVVVSEICEVLLGYYLSHFRFEIAQFFSFAVFSGMRSGVAYLENNIRKLYSDLCYQKIEVFSSFPG